MLGGARVADERGAPPQRERGPEYVADAGLAARSTGCHGSSASTRRASLWDALEMGAPADVHCYTPAEFDASETRCAAVREAADHGLDLLS